MATPDEAPHSGHPFLEARHVDNLTQAVRALNMNVATIADTAKRQLEASNKILQATLDNTKAQQESTKVMRRLLVALGQPGDDLSDQVTPGGIRRSGKKT